METVNHTAAVFQVVQETGYRATVGKCMMDKGDEVPAALHEDTAASIDESLALLEQWHGKEGGRIRIASHHILQSVALPSCFPRRAWPMSAG